MSELQKQDEDCIFGPEWDFILPKSKCKEYVGKISIVQDYREAPFIDSIDRQGVVVQRQLRPAKGART